MNHLPSGLRSRRSIVCNETVDRSIKDLYYTEIIRVASAERRLN